MIKKNKKGLSAVITTVIMIALVMAAAVIVWTIISNMVEEGLEGAESCFGNYGKVKINGRYTCFDDSVDPPITQFSLSIGDIDVDKVIIQISGEGQIKNFELTNKITAIDGLYNYTMGENITLPGKNGGYTYKTDIFSQMPDAIEIAPVIGGKQCEISDSTSTIDLCKSLI